jgi:competence ComEA-like helix-hairpin-helix protein
MRWLVFSLLLLLLFPPHLAGDDAAHPKLNQASAVVLDINQASVDEFATLPGIGPKLAGQIVAYREKHGPFRRVEDLVAIRGIGPKKWKAIRPHLRVGAALSREAESSRQ